MLHVAAKIALGPVLYAQAMWTRRRVNELPEPDGERSGSVGAGETQLRLLVAGDSSAAGVGARTQEEALALPLARRLAERLSARVDWQLVAESGLTSEGVLRKLTSVELQSADLAIVICGVNDITNQHRFAYALEQRQRVAEWLRLHAGVRRVLFPALPEMDAFPAIPQPLAWWSGLLARRNNLLQQRWAQELDFVAHVPMDGLTDPALFSEDGFHPAPGLYARVAERLADVIATETLPSMRRQTLTEEVT